MSLCLLLSGCGNTSQTTEEPATTEASSNNTVIGDEMTDYRIEYLPDENAPLIQTYKEIIDKVDEGTTSAPTDLTTEDFYAYYSYSGNDARNVRCLIYADRGYLMAFKEESSGADVNKYAGILYQEDSFVNVMRSLPYIPVEHDEDEDGKKESYGFIYFKKDGKIYSFATKNIFDNE